MKFEVPANLRSNHFFKGGSSQIPPNSTLFYLLGLFLHPFEEVCLSLKKILFFYVFIKFMAELLMAPKSLVLKLETF
jgi:hypothetical protein